MALANQLILIGALLLLLSIFVGLISSRIGAPLLLVFLGLGMLFGEDGPGGIQFDNYYAAYLIGSISLAVIPFDGGLRTDLGSFRLAARPAILLATVGVALTAALTGVAAYMLLGLGPVKASWSAPSSARPMLPPCSSCSTCTASTSESGCAPCSRWSRA